MAASGYERVHTSRRLEYQRKIYCLIDPAQICGATKQIIGAQSQDAIPWFGQYINAAEA